MVGVINAPAANQSRTLKTYREGAQKAAENVSPGGAVVNSTAVSTSTSTSTVMGTDATVTSVVVASTGTSASGGVGGAAATTSSRVASATGGAAVAARGGMAGLGLGLVGLMVAVAL